jgi:hypothetical protein
LQRRISTKVPATPPVINDVIVVIAGLALYVAFTMRAHSWLLGVSPLS